MRLVLLHSVRVCMYTMMVQLFASVLRWCRPVCVCAVLRTSGSRSSPFPLSRTAAARRESRPSRSMAARDAGLGCFLASRASRTTSRGFAEERQTQASGLVCPFLSLSLSTSHATSCRDMYKNFHSEMGCATYIASRGTGAGKVGVLTRCPTPLLPPRKGVSQDRVRVRILIRIPRVFY